MCFLSRFFPPVLLGFISYIGVLILLVIDSLFLLFFFFTRFDTSSMILLKITRALIEFERPKVLFEILSGNLVWIPIKDPEGAVVSEKKER